MCIYIYRERETYIYIHVYMCIYIERETYIHVVRRVSVDSSVGHVLPISLGEQGG